MAPTWGSGRSDCLQPWNRIVPSGGRGCFWRLDSIVEQRRTKHTGSYADFWSTHNESLAGTFWPDVCEGQNQFLPLPWLHCTDFVLYHDLSWSPSQKAWNQKPSPVSMIMIIITYSHMVWRLEVCAVLEGTLSGLLTSTFFPCSHMPRSQGEQAFLSLLHTVLEIEPRASACQVTILPSEFCPVRHLTPTLNFL